MKKIKDKNCKFQTKRGFTLAEIVVAVAIALAIFLAVFNFGQGIFYFNYMAQKNLSAQTDAKMVLKSMVKELRSASPSSRGAYPLAVVGTSTLTFFTDLDDDGLKEQVRYFLQGSELERGVIKPSGAPLAYNPTDEKINTMVHDINNAATPIFDYFDSSYTGESAPLSQPVQATQVRLIRITVMIESDPNRSPAPTVVQSQVFLRNLKDNL